MPQSGIGEELSRELIRRKWKVAALDIKAQSGPGQSLTQALGGDFFYIPCDVSKYDEMADAFSQVFTKWGQINAFCSNAGIIDKSSILIFNYRGKTEYVLGLLHLQTQLRTNMQSFKSPSRTESAVHRRMLQGDCVWYPTFHPLHETKSNTWRLHHRHI